MLCAPTPNEEVVNMAEPLLRVAGEPRLFTPSLNCTVPVGFPEPGATAETEAVKLTDWPKLDGFSDEMMVVLLLALLTVCVGNEPVLPVKFVSPLYTAVMLCVPTLNDEVVNVAEPLLSATGDPRLPAPSLNCTVPVGVPEPGASADTVAVKVTA